MIAKSLTEEQILEIEARANRDLNPRYPTEAEQAAIESFNFHAQEDVERLVATIRSLQAERNRFSILADERHDQICEVRRQRDDLASKHAAYTNEVLRDYRSRILEAIKTKADEWEASNKASKSYMGTGAREILKQIEEMR